MTVAPSRSSRPLVWRWLQAAPESALALVLANLVPLVGVLLLGWGLGAILIVYWLESGIIGLLNVPKMLLARGPLTVERSGTALSLPVLIEGAPALAAKLFMTLFFGFHYGFFWIGHGIFVFLIPSMTGPGAGVSIPVDLDDPFSSAGVDPAWVVIAAAILFVSHLISFRRNYLARREYLSVSPIQQMAAPYSRVVVMHVTILGGALLTLLLGTPVAALVVLVALKTGLDLRAHLKERARAARQRSDQAEASLTQGSPGDPGVARLPGEAP